MTFRQLRMSILSLTFVSSAGLVACSGGGEPSDPHDRLDQVKDAISSPSGQVDAKTMKKISQSFADAEAAAPVFAALGAIGNGSQCGSSDTSGTLDLSCSTEGSVTGSVDYDIDVSGGLTSADETIVATIDNACANGVCASGSVIIEAHVDSGNVTTSEAMSIDVTKDGKKTHLYFGEQLAVAEGSVNAKLVFFDGAGDSYVFDTQIGESGASYKIEGANGSFECSFTETSGQCSGSASFDF
jgi:hypothetical protein